MKKHSISIVSTNNDNIVKFESNHFLTTHQSFEFNNIDETANSPLAKELFYLPFIKKVYISSNFIAIEKYNIVEWEDVAEDVAEQIQEYLNSDKEAVVAKEETKQTPVTVYAESTPNPGVMKFVANKKLVPSGYEFKSIEDAKISPLATKLFHYPFIKEVYMDENYISISKYDIAEWNDIVMDLRDEIRNFIAEGNTIVDTHAAKPITTKIETSENASSVTEDLSDTSKRIIDIINEYVKPAVASDGGNILFESYDESSQEVKVILQGACSGCPSSTMTLKNGIETMLKEMIPGKIGSVTAING